MVLSSLLIRPVLVNGSLGGSLASAARPADGGSGVYWSVALYHCRLVERSFCCLVAADCPNLGQGT